MLKRICDKCGKDMKTWYAARIYEYGYEEYGFRNDLCMECAIEVQNFIKPRNDVEERMRDKKLILEPKQIEDSE